MSYLANEFIIALCVSLFASMCEIVVLFHLVPLFFLLVIGAVRSARLCYMSFWTDYSLLTDCHGGHILIQFFLIILVAGVNLYVVHLSGYE
jgi:hypothetical protein